MLALIGLCAFTWTGSDDKTRTDEWLRGKKLAAISCSPYVTAFTDNSMYRNDELRTSDDRLVGETEHQSSHHRPPLDPQNENGCSHQQGSLCETNYSKRKLLKIHHRLKEIQ
jgi:hypothetical protein